MMFNTILRKTACLALCLFISQISLQAQALTGTKTIGTGGSYTTLTLALSAATTNGISGPVIFELLSTYNSSSETYPISIGAITGSSATNTLTIRPQTGATGLSITSAGATTTLQLAGCQNIIIDGRPGGTGSFTSGNNLVIANTLGSSPAVLFINEASFNSIKYCDLQSNNSTIITATSGGGVVCFGATIGANGNDNNLLSYCNIHGQGSGNPVMCVFGYGGISTLTQGNDSTVIDNCNLYDFNSTVATAGLNVSSGCNAWTITNNHFYQTSPISHGTAVTHRVIYVTAGSGYTLSGNYIGGNSASGTGMYSINAAGAAAANVLFAFDYTSTTTTSITTIANNTITNIDYSTATSGSGAMALLQIYGGNVNCTNNLIGSNTSNGAIKFTTYNATAGAVSGLIALRVGTSANLVNLTGNTISGIDMYGNQPSYAPEFHGVNLTTGTATSVFTATNNTIGSTTLANSINIVSPCASSTAASRLDGFIINTTQAIVSLTVANNIVANLNTNYSATGTQAASVRAIWFNPQAAGNFYINNNQVYNISTASQTTGTGVNSALIGISVNTTTSPVSITGNTVSALFLTGTSTTAAVQCDGIFYSGNTATTNVADRNFIHHLTLTAVNPNAIINGVEVNNGQLTLQNNMISLGYDTSGASITTPCTLRGVIKNAAGVNLYHNTLFIGGSGVGNSTNATSAFVRAVVATDDFRNNILVNTRSNSGSGGTHYQVFLAGNTTLTSNYNLYYGTGTGSVFAFNGNNDVAVYSSGWVSGDNSSNVGNPNLTLSGGSLKNTNLHITAVGNKGIAISGLSNDFDGDVRNNPPDVGADEIPIDLGVVSIDSPTTGVFCGQNKDLWIKFKNYGLITITSAQFNININGSLFRNFNWSGSLAPGATSASINLGAQNFFNPANYAVAINSTLPNGKLDNNLNNDTAKANYATTQSVTPQVICSTPFTTVCLGSNVTFKATFTNAGNAPVFSWKKNGVTVGTNDSSFTTNTLANNDSISVVMTSNANCALPATVSASYVKMTVSSSLVPSVTLFPNSASLCAGTSSKTFQALLTNGGATPHYQWQRNRVNVGTDSAFYTLPSPLNNDSLRCIMTSSLSCASKLKDTSAALVVVVNPNIVPTITVSATSPVICTGAKDTFTAVTNGGTVTWYKNSGVLLNTLYVDTLISSTLIDGDSVYGIVNNSGCASPHNTTSNKIRVTVSSFVSPSASITASKNSLCAGDTITFKATYTNGGSSPLREWYKNSTLFQNGVDSFKTINLANKDTIYLKLTSNGPCLIKNTAVSNQQLMTVNPVVTPSVTMNAASNTICNGTPVQFNATPVNGGTTPHFVWRKNGVIIGTDSTRYTTNLLSDKDSVWVILTSNALCASKTNDTSAKVVMTVNPTVTPTISVSTGSNTFCPGSKVSFTTTATNTGTTPHYQWYKNSTAVGTDSTGFAASNFADHDTVYVMLTSSVACPTVNNLKSNKVILFMLPGVSASVSISGNANNVCKGTPVTFTAAPVNGGTPTYQWKINGTNAGTNNAVLIADTLKNGDSVSVLMTSSTACAVPTVSQSNKIGMIIKPSLMPKVTISASKNTICPGEVITFTATDSNGGSAPTHTWLKFNAPTGSDSVTFTSAIVSSQTIQCVLTPNIACPAKAKDTASFVVTVKPLPAKPVITRNWDTLTSTVAPSYQWLFNNANLNGETNQKLILTQNGNYKVTVDSNGCKNTSDVYAFTFIGLSESVDFGTLSLFPNPTNGSVSLNVQFKTSDLTLIQVMDMTGKIIENAELGNVNTINNHVIDLSNLNSGAYLVYVKHGDRFEVRKVVRGE